MKSRKISVSVTVEARESYSDNPEFEFSFTERIPGEQDPLEYIKQRILTEAGRARVERDTQPGDLH